MHISNQPISVWFLIATATSLVFSCTVCPVHGRPEGDHFFRSASVRKTPTPSADSRHVCGQRLRYAIDMICRSSPFLGEMRAALNLNSSSSVNDAAAADFSVQRSENETAAAGRRPEQHPEHRSGRAPIGLITEAHSTTTVLTRLPRSVVDECCERPCEADAMMKYCNRLRQKSAPTTTSTTGRMQPDWNSNSGSIMQAGHAASPTQRSTETVTGGGGATDDVQRFVTQSSLSLQQQRQGPWKAMRRRPTSLESSSTRISRENRRARQHQHQDQLALLSFIVRLPIPTGRRSWHLNQKRRLRRLRTHSPLRANREQGGDGAAVTAAVDALNALTQFASGAASLTNFLGPTAVASALKKGRVVSGLSSLPLTWSRPSLNSNSFPRLLKTRDTYRIPFLQQAHTRKHTHATSEGQAQTQSRRRSDNRFLHQDNDEHVQGAAVDAQTHHHHHHYRNTDSQEHHTHAHMATAAGGSYAHEMPTTTERPDGTTKHNVYVFPIGIYDEVLGHGRHAL